jgi:hypothetical protein
VQALYSPDGARLYTAGADGGLCVYDVAQVYMPVKFLSAGQRDLKVGGWAGGCGATSAATQSINLPDPNRTKHV